MADSGRVSVSQDGDCTTIVGDGILDLYTADFGGAMREAAANAENVVVDFRTTKYIDTHVLADLVKGAQILVRRGKRLKVLLTRPSHPLRTLEITGLSVILDMIVEEPEPKE